MAEDTTGVFCADHGDMFHEAACPLWPPTSIPSAAPEFLRLFLPQRPVTPALPHRPLPYAALQADPRRL
jgi:hypothetical protein